MYFVYDLQLNEYKDKNWWFSTDKKALLKEFAHDLRESGAPNSDDDFSDMTDKEVLDFFEYEIVEDK